MTVLPSSDEHPQVAGSGHLHFVISSSCIETQFDWRAPARVLVWSAQNVHWLAICGSTWTILSVTVVRSKRALSVEICVAESRDSLGGPFSLSAQELIWRFPHLRLAACGWL